MEIRPFTPSLLGAVLLLSGTAMQAAEAAPVFAVSSYTADVVFSDASALEQTRMTISFDGTSYFSASGGSNSGPRVAQFAADGSLIDTYSPGLDLRSVFTNGGHEIFARQYDDSTIYKQTSPGSFSAQLTLSGNPLDEQSAVVLNRNGQFVAMADGLVSLWDGNGQALSTFALAGFGSQNDEGGYPANRGIAAVGDHLFTYSAGIVSAWDYSGQRVDSATLVDAGTRFDSYFSFSYANGRFFVLDDANGAWRGYDAGLGSDVAPVPLPASVLMMGGALVALGLRRRTAARH